MDEDSRFPVRRIFRIGRNYANHAKETGAAPERGQPVFFTKQADLLVSDGQDVPHPRATRLLHHEVEMMVAPAADGCVIGATGTEVLIFDYGMAWS